MGGTSTTDAPLPPAISPEAITGDGSKTVPSIRPTPIQVLDNCLYLFDLGMDEGWISLEPLHGATKDTASTTATYGVLLFTPWKLDKPELWSGAGTILEARPTVERRNVLRWPAVTEEPNLVGSFFGLTIILSTRVGGNEMCEFDECELWASTVGTACIIM